MTLGNSLALGTLMGGRNDEWEQKLELWEQWELVFLLGGTTTKTCYLDTAAQRSRGGTYRRIFFDRQTDRYRIR